MPMRELVIDRLYGEFGVPVAETDTALCWHLADRFDLIAQKDSPPDQGNLWIPWRTDDPFMDFAEFFDADSDRPQGTYNQACPSLARGRPAVVLPVRRQQELDRAIAAIRMGMDPPVAP